jgi:hypothetical protein
MRVSVAYASWHEGYVCPGRLDDDWTNLDQTIAS